MKLSPVTAFILLVGASLIILPVAGIPLGSLLTPRGMVVGFVLLLGCLLALTLISPFTRPKSRPTAPAHPLTKAGHIFAVISLVFAALSIMLDARLGLFTAATFILLAIVCWVFGAVFKRA